MNALRKFSNVEDQAHQTRQGEAKQIAPKPARLLATWHRLLTTHLGDPPARPRRWPMRQDRALCSARPLACDFRQPSAGSVKATPGRRSRCRTKDAALTSGGPALGSPIHGRSPGNLRAPASKAPRLSGMTCRSRYSFNSLTIREGEKAGLFARDPRTIDSCVGVCHMANAQNRR